MTATKKFIAARHFLLSNRNDYEKAYREFRWPDLSDFNWAHDWFDVYAQDNHKTALWLRTEDKGELKFSYRDLAERSNRVAHFLQHYGVESGDRIVLCLPNVSAMWELILAAIKVGAVVVPTTTLATESEIRDRLERSGARMVVTDESAMERIPLETELKRILVGGHCDGWMPYEAAMEESQTYRVVATQASDPFLLYFTVPRQRKWDRLRPQVKLHI